MSSIENINREGYDSTEYALIRGNADVGAAIDSAISLVGSTYGPEGSNVLLADARQTVFDDGFLTLQSYLPENPVQRGIVERLLGAARLQHSKYYDGTSTAILTTAAVIRAGLALPKSEASTFVSELMAVLPQLSKEISGSARPATEEYVVAATTIAAHGNKVLGEKIGRAMWKLGRWGVLQPRLHDGSDIVVEVDGGYSYAGVVTRDMWNAPDGVRYNSAVLVLLQHELDREQDPGFRAVLEAYASVFKETDGRTALIFVGANIKGSARAMLAKRTDSSGRQLPIAVVPPPGDDDNERLLFLNDMKALFGGKVFSQTQGTNLTTFKPVDFAKVDEVYGNLSSIVFRSHAAHTEFDGNASMARKAAATLESSEKRSVSGKDEAKEAFLRRRLGALNGSMGRILIPNYSEGVVRATAEIIDDATGAARSALGGVVPGGQSSVIWACQKVKMSEALRNAILFPASLIWGHGNTIVSASSMLPGGDDAFSEGVVDAKDSVIGALENAATTAAEVIKSEYIIYKTPIQ